MLIAQRVNDFITAGRPAAFCDLCIVKALNLTQTAHASQNTAALGTTSDFTRAKGQCSSCKNERIVIRATRN